MVWIKNAMVVGCLLVCIYPLYRMAAIVGINSNQKTQLQAAFDAGTTFADGWSACEKSYGITWIPDVGWICNVTGETNSYILRTKSFDYNAHLMRVTNHVSPGKH